MIPLGYLGAISEQADAAHKHRSVRYQQGIQLICETTFRPMERMERRMMSQMRRIPCWDWRRLRVDSICLLLRMHRPRYPSGSLLNW